MTNSLPYRKLPTTYFAMKQIIGLFILTALSFSSVGQACESELVARPVTLSSTIHDVSRRHLSFDKGVMAIHLPYEPVQHILHQLQETVVLKSRGEAHLTVLTPQEMKALQKVISHTELKRLAENVFLVANQLQVLALGSARAQVNGELHATYFLILDSSGWVDFRTRLAEILWQRGYKEFRPFNYQPHITIGFTLRDLHESDGVVKDLSSHDQRFPLIQVNGGAKD